MSKSSSDGLFGVTLTELVIILFFIMLLLAIFNIDKISKEKEEAIVLKEEAQRELDGFLIDINAGGGTITFPTFVWEGILIKLGELDPTFGDFIINGDLGDISVFEEALTKALSEKVIMQEENKKLAGMLEEIGKDPDQMPDPQDGAGNCGTGYWITSKCADHCWEIDSADTNRKYDYLLDIGICESSVVVQRSKWLQNNESNFLLVDGAISLTNQKYMKASELYQFLDIIKEPGYIKEPKQCFYSVNVIALDQVGATRFTPVSQGIAERVNRRNIVDPNTSSYQNVKSRFSEDACNISTNEIKNYQVKDNNTTPIKPRNTNKNDSFKSIDETPISSSNIVNASMDTTSFNKRFRYECNQTNVGRTRALSLEYSIEINDKGRVISAELTDNNPNLSGPEKRLNNLIIRAINRTSFKPQEFDGIPIDSFLTQKVRFPKDVCRSSL